MSVQHHLTTDKREIKFLKLFRTTSHIRSRYAKWDKKDRYSFDVSQNRLRYTAFLQFDHEFGQKVEIWQNTENGIAKGQP